MIHEATYHFHVDIVLEDNGSALLEVDGRYVGELVSLPESKLTGKKWARIQFSRADLVRSALRLLDDGEVGVPGEGPAPRVPLCRFGDLGQVGPDRRRLVDGFDRTNTVTAYPLVAGHDSEQRRTISVPLIPTYLHCQNPEVASGQDTVTTSGNKRAVSSYLKG